MKTIPHDHYTYRVTWSEEDKEYVGLCAEFPGLSWLPTKLCIKIIPEAVYFVLPCSSPLGKQRVRTDIRRAGLKKINLCALWNTQIYFVSQY